VASDPDGDAFWINDQGQAVGYSGTCTAALHAVSWEHGTASPLPDFGTGAIAQGINNQGQIVGAVGSADGTTQYGALWQNDALTNLGLLPGDFGGEASGINSKGQVVGSNFDSNFNWSHAFLWQDGVMADLNALLPATANLFSSQPWLTRSTSAGKSRAWQRCSAGRMRATSTPFWQPLSTKAWAGRLQR
jgi:probable HAF family extracellular repeat protein